MEEAEKLCDELAIIDHGKIIAAGTLRELQAGFGGNDIIQLSGSFDTARVEQAVADLNAEILSLNSEVLMIAIRDGARQLPPVLEAEDVTPEPEEAAKYRRLIIPSNFTAQLKTDQQVSITFEGLRSGFGNQYDFFRLQKATYSVLGDLIVVKAGGAVISPAELALATAEPRPVKQASSRKRVFQYHQIVGNYIFAPAQEPFRQWFACR